MTAIRPKAALASRIRWRVIGLAVVVVAAGVGWFALGRAGLNEVRDRHPTAERSITTRSSPVHLPGPAMSGAKRVKTADHLAPTAVVRSGGAPHSAVEPQRVQFVAAPTRMRLGGVDWKAEGPPGPDGDAETEEQQSAGL